MYYEESIQVGLGDDHVSPQFVNSTNLSLTQEHAVEARLVFRIPKLITPHSIVELRICFKSRSKYNLRLAFWRYRKQNPQVETQINVLKKIRKQANE